MEQNVLVAYLPGGCAPGAGTSRNREGRRGVGGKPRLKSTKWIQ